MMLPSGERSHVPCNNGLLQQPAIACHSDPRAVPVWQDAGSLRAGPQCDLCAARRCEDADGDVDCWFDQVGLIFSYQEGEGVHTWTRECIFVRWYDVAAFDESDRHLCGPFVKLKWETLKLPGSNVVKPRYDVVDLAKIVKAVCIQLHPVKDGVFFYNRNV